jgi:hypothetical protein
LSGFKRIAFEGLGFGQMVSQTMIDRAHSIVEAWLPKYPTTSPWVDDVARAALRRSEDVWLAKFDGLDSLTKNQLDELITWKWRSRRPQLSRSQEGANDNWDHTSDCIARALAEAGANAAIDVLRGPTGGIRNWQTAMASVVLAVCRPEYYTIADSRALRTMMLLEGKSQRAIDNTNYFQRHYWDSYLITCRALRGELHVRLRDLDRAFWASAGQPFPAS